MTLILTNDDGIDAPGIGALRQALAVCDRPLVTIAPRDPQSGCGHQVTTHVPIEVSQRSEQAWAIAGTPADCVRLAIAHLCPQPQWVISGINAGGNLGADVYISGTVAAVREAALHRIPGIAISQYIKRGQTIDWAWTTQLAATVLAELFDRPLAPGSYWNVNLPHLPPDSPMPKIVVCSPCTQPLPVTYHQEGDRYVYAGVYGERSRDPNGDVAVCFADKIAVTQLRI